MFVLLVKCFSLFLSGFVSDQQVLEEREHQLKVQQQRRDAAGERLVGHVKTLNAIRAGIEHLAGKLQHISLVNHTHHSPLCHRFW